MLCLLTFQEFDAKCFISYTQGVYEGKASYKCNANFCSCMTVWKIEETPFL